MPITYFYICSALKSLWAQGDVSVMSERENSLTLIYTGFDLSTDAEATLGKSKVQKVLTKRA